MLKIWGRATSSNVQKVLWACTELDLEFERLDWGGKYGGNNDPAYRAMNPNGLVPTVLDGELILWESNSILRYLCGKYNGARLLPVEPGARSLIERWMDWQLSRLNTPMAAMLWGYFRTPPEKRDAAALAKHREDSLALWRVIEEQQLGRHDYVAGKDFSLADIVIGIWLHRWYHYPIERPDLPQLKAYYDRIAKRPGFVTHISAPPS
jgi:glutathione S-transferase